MRQAVQDILAARSGRSQRRQQQISAAVAMLFHALIVTAAFAVPHFTREKPQPIEYVEVRVLPPQALGVERPAPEPEPAPPSPAPEPEPEPEPEEEATEALPPPEESPAEPEQREEPEPEPSRAEPDRPREPQQSAEGSPDDSEGSPEGAPGGTSRLGAQVVGADGTAFPYDYYLDQMLSQIHRNWRRPPVEGVRTVVTFRVRQNGEITEIDVRQSSGSRSFDLAAIRALRNASPLPPLPASYRKGSLTVNLIVR